MMNIINLKDVSDQARWEIYIEDFEEAVKKEKLRLRNKKYWFPWRLVILNLNKRNDHDR